MNFDNNQSTSTSTVYKLTRRITRSNLDNSENIGENSLSGKVNKLGNVSIPSPDVPEDFPVNLDQDVFSLAIDDNAYDENSKI